MLGVQGVEFLGYEYGELEDTRDLRWDVTGEIRRWQRELIITLSPYRTYTNFPGWHQDHRTTARVVLDCISRWRATICPFLSCCPTTSLTRCAKCEVYMVRWEQPRLVVDITDTMELKLEAIRCHKSQVSDFKA